jgi:hypothetical protein
MAIERKREIRKVGETDTKNDCSLDNERIDTKAYNKRILMFNPKTE